MQPSIEQLEADLGEGRLRLPDLLALRLELRCPFRLHPLGFIACTLLTQGKKKFRLHFWPVEGGAQQSPECQIHDHLFEFRSWVLSGSVENIEYTASSNGKEFAIYRTEYGEDRSTLIKTDQYLKLAEARRDTFHEGSSYAVAAGVLHETVRVGAKPALTVLVTTDVSSTAPMVFGPPGGHDHYVYERSVLEESLVQALLAEA